MLKKIFMVTLVVGLFLIGSQTLSLAQIGRGLGSFGGEWRGLTRVKGKVVCASCTVANAREADPSLPAKLYEFSSGEQSAVFQMIGVGEVGGNQDANDLAYWLTVTGMRKQVPLRITEGLWLQLIAGENRQKEVELTGFLRSTGTFDVAQLTFPEMQ